MCRVYGSGDHKYVRLCYRTGRAGQRVYFKGEPPLLPSGHYGAKREAPSTGIPRRRLRRPCVFCGAHLAERDGCQSCRDCRRRLADPTEEFLAMLKAKGLKLPEREPDHAR